ncbi:hypothetical protein MMC27_005075 [Xylographa pallens]|nr:hypothetical protein [Xylographa pallens]
MSSQDDDGDWETGSEDSHESDMPSFPDWPKLFHMRPGDWFHGTKGYAQYKDEDKGHLAGEDMFPPSETKLTFTAYPEHSVPCSVKFLHYILHDFVLVWVATWFTRSDFEVDEILIVSSNICREVKRLQNHRELFPSKEMGEEFLDIVYDICESLEKAMAKFQGHRDLWHKLLDEEIAEVKAASWPTFQAGRNAWHQFLHNGAPGHRVIPKQASNTESMQLIPPGGLNLLQAWQTEIEDVLKTYDEVSKLQFDPSALENIMRPDHVLIPGVIAPTNTSDSFQCGWR